MEKEFVSISLTPEKANEIMSFYSAYAKEDLGDYIIFQAIYSGIIITVYQNKKGKQKVVFGGPGALKEAKKWDETVELKVKEDKPVGWLCKENQIGSDEVGVGDFLLPVTVVAAFVRGRDLKMLDEFGVKDSKKVTDEKIREIAPLLLKKFFVSRLTLDNEHYNELIKKGEKEEDTIYKLTGFELNKSVDKLVGGAEGLVNQKYKAPEILNNEANNKSAEELNLIYQKADIWSLGIIIYILYFGKFPFMGNKANEVLSNIKKNGTSIDEVNDLDLKDLLKKMLNQKKEERIDWNDYFSHKFFSSEKWQ